MEIIYILAAWAAFEVAVYFFHKRRPQVRSQATKGLTMAQRQVLRSAQHLHDERVRVIERMGSDWCLHPNYRRNKA